MHRHPRTLFMATIVTITGAAFLWAMTAAGPVIPTLLIPLFGLTARIGLRDAHRQDQSQP